MTPVHGHCADRFSTVREIFVRNLENGNDVGASVSLIVDGETVVDLWGGWTDTSRTIEWAKDTLVPVHSTSKTMVALCALLLVERGLLDPYAPVIDYWPEFGQAGKSDIRVRHLMSHTSGLSGWAQPVEPSDIYDWPKATAMLSSQEPWWEPGTASGYHLLSYNHLVGELVRRVSGVPVADFFDAEVAGPMDADYHFGLDDSIAARVSWNIPTEEVGLDIAALDPAGVAMKTFTGPFLFGYVTDTTIQSTRFPMNGFANARSIARAQAAVSHGGQFNGVRLLSPSTIDTIFDVQSDGIDLVLGVPVSFGIGYAMPGADWPRIPRGRTCWWAGMGGSRIINSLDHRMTLGYAMNKMNPALIGDHRSDDLFAAAVEVLES
jgi:CubicO group peptidase (beta-lactamase class C family)